jgi:murein L,D-transpeptidase YafK/ketosteroid isomerase-like protein
MSTLQDYDCTTGQVAGDKMTSGDLRTPEGVYFVVTKIDRGLDFTEYGGIAYPLNYPNPVDILHGKTGYGIWLHSRGKDIVPLSTKGCVAIDLDAIGRLGPHLRAGTAVVVAENVATDARPATKAESAITSLLEDKTRKWNTAWAGRSSEFFAMYNPDAYSKAQQSPFAAFRSQKERLFAVLPWIHIVYRDINVMQGPDYWVTWFEQYYRAPNMTAEGVRRLYWQPGDNGDLRIVGMEWLPQNVGLETSYLETITPGVAKFIETWRKAWAQANAKAYAALYAPDSRQGVLSGRENIQRTKEGLWKRTKPTKVELAGLRIMLDRGGIKADMTQVYRDSTGKGDKGVKTLILQPQGDSWLISAESWSSL